MKPRNQLILSLFMILTIGIQHGDGLWEFESFPFLRLVKKIFFDSHHTSTSGKPLTRGINGGMACATCTVLVGRDKSAVFFTIELMTMLVSKLSLTEQVAQINNETTIDGLQRLCSYLPSRYESSCRQLVIAITPVILEEVLRHTSPDTICYKLGVCFIQTNKTMCHLFPLPSVINEVKDPLRNFDVSDQVPSNLLHRSHQEGLPWFCFVPGVSKLCQALENVYDKLVPGVDLDGDKFSPVETLRGSIWRGRDCSDFSSSSYPGKC